MILSQYHSQTDIFLTDRRFAFRSYKIQLLFSETETSKTEKGCFQFGICGHIFNFFTRLLTKSSRNFILYYDYIDYSAPAYYDYINYYYSADLRLALLQYFK
jgi:hypothetical protein